MSKITDYFEKERDRGVSERGYSVAESPLTEKGRARVCTPQHGKEGRDGSPSPGSALKSFETELKSLKERIHILKGDLEKFREEEIRRKDMKELVWYHQLSLRKCKCGGYSRFIWKAPASASWRIYYGEYECIECGAKEVLIDRLGGKGVSGDGR